MRLLAICESLIATCSAAARRLLTIRLDSTRILQTEPNRTDLRLRTEAAVAANETSREQCKSNSEEKRREVNRQHTHIHTHTQTERELEQNKIHFCSWLATRTRTRKQHRISSQLARPTCGLRAASGEPRAESRLRLGIGAARCTVQRAGGRAGAQAARSQRLADRPTGRRANKEREPSLCAVYAFVCCCFLHLLHLLHLVGVRVRVRLVVGWGKKRGPFLLGSDARSLHCPAASETRAPPTASCNRRKRESGARCPKLPEAS